MLLQLNIIFQYVTQACRVVWPSYDESQTVAGAVCINVTFGLAIMLGVTSGIMQGIAEGRLRKQRPDVFPPTTFQYALAAWRRERERARDSARDAEERERASSVRIAIESTELSAGADPLASISVSAVSSNGNGDLSDGNDDLDSFCADGLQSSVAAATDATICQSTLPLALPATDAGGSVLQEAYLRAEMRHEALERQRHSSEQVLEEIGRLTHEM